MSAGIKKVLYFRNYFKYEETDISVRELRDKLYSDIESQEIRHHTRNGR